MAVETVTVLFTDLVGSTELLSRLGPHRAEALRREHFELLRSALVTNRGREVKNLGDGLMAVFGSALAALDAAVAMQQSLELRNRGADELMAIRVGVTTGEADAVDGDYFGPPVIEAARLCAAAEGGEVLASEVVALLVGTRSAHRFGSVGDLDLKGLAEPVATVRVQWSPLEGREIAGLPMPRRLRRTDGTAFVGRDVERERLAIALAAVTARGGRRIVLVGGEPGIGKTALVAEAAATAHAEGALVAYGRCDEDLSIPYQPWREVFRHLAADDAIRPDALERLLRTDAPAPCDESGVAEGERHRLFAAVTEALTDVSVRTPLVLVLDDLHWADTQSCALLRHVATTADAMRVVVVGTYRDTDLDPMHPLADLLAALHQEQGVDRLHLSGLGEVELLAMLQDLVGDELGDGGPALRDAVLDETDGNPFFALQIVRHLVETGAVGPGTGRPWSAPDLRAHGLPVSVREVTGQRVARLGAEVQRVLRLAAVIGRDFDLELLAEVVDSDEGSLLELLEPALDHGLIIELGPARFSFAHAHIEHTLYRELGASRCASAHRAVARSLEARYGAEGVRAGELAHHWLAASTLTDDETAVTAARRAGDYALASLAPTEASQWYERALERLDRASLATERTLDHRLELTIGLGAAQRQLGDPSFRASLLGAARLAADEGRSDELARAVLAVSRGNASNTGTVDTELVALLQQAVAETAGETTPRRALLLGCLAIESAFGDSRDAEALAREAVAMALEVGDDRTTTWTVCRAFNAARDLGCARERAEWCKLARAAANRLDDPFADLECLYGEMYSALERGHIAEYTNLLDRHRVLAGRVDDAFHTWISMNWTANRAALAGDPARAEALAGEGLAIGSDRGQPDASLVHFGQLVLIRDMQGRLPELTEHLDDIAGTTSGIPAARAAHALALVRAGRRAEAVEVLASDVADGFASFHGLLGGAAMAVAGEAIALLGGPEPAKVLYELVLPHGELLATFGYNTYEALHWTLGRLAFVTGDLDASDQHCSRALEIHRAMGAPYFVARTEWAWAESLAIRGRPGDPDRARGLARRAYAAAAARGYAQVERDSGHLLARLG